MDEAILSREWSDTASRPTNYFANSVSAWRESHDRDASMLQVACCLGFFGFLRAAEFTEVRERGPPHVAVDSHNDQSMRIHIKQTKTDPFRKGVHIYLGHTHSDIYPVTSISQYLAMRGPGNGPLLLCRDGSPLSRAKLVQRVRSALLIAGIDPQVYCGHSFQIGVATTAQRMEWKIPSSKLWGGGRARQTYNMSEFLVVNWLQFPNL